MLDFNGLTRIKDERPLLHCVSNIVSANDCANLALAVGASPMMAQALEEMTEITAISSATVLNTGTPDRERFAVCRICGQAAQAIGQPVILDPVGVGAGSWRLKEVTGLLESFRPSIIRVNLGEAEALCRRKGYEQGVDSTVPVAPEKRAALANELACRYETTVLLTGDEDVVSDGIDTLVVTGGSLRMARVTGTGCMLSVLCGAFAAVESDAFAAAALASAYWKLCAERASEATQGRGIGSFRAELMNAAEQIDAKALEARGNIRTISG